MTPALLTRMTPAQRQGWEILLDLEVERPSHAWCLVGGQMVWLFACENDVEPPRATEDIDVLVDIRADQESILRLCRWLEQRGLDLDGISAEGIGHRYCRSMPEGHGRVMFDVLAPDHLGDRTDRTTTPPARTVSVPGGRMALDDVEVVSVILEGREGVVRRPRLLSAILAKAAATTIAGRANPHRDLADLAFLLSLVLDPIEVAGAFTKGQRRTLQKIATLLDDEHPAWSAVGERAELGHTALRFLLDA